MPEKKKKDPLTRLMSYVEKSDGCWMWTGGLMSRGLPYGKAWLNGRTIPAHRAVWILTYGSIDRRSLVCHACDVPACVNPSHLFLGSPAENTADMFKKGRAHDRRGENAGGSKLTVRDVDLIREMISRGVTQDEIAQHFAVSQTMVSRIKTKKSWAA